MNVEIGTETPIFLFWEYFEISVFCLCNVRWSFTYSIFMDRLMVQYCNKMPLKTSAGKFLRHTDFGSSSNTVIVLWLCHSERGGGIELGMKGG